ncbi:hypothetical protein BZA77DRAFT_362191 [Pyronema omphalodes]|nr:hypothetical protein BZA77DRAFT_362191 [Pyronema omphalodes]
MHSKHTTTAAQDKLDTLKFNCPLPLLAITSTESTPEPQPDGSSVQDTSLPDAPSTAPAGTDGWKTVEAKATQKKKTKAKETISAAVIPNQTSRRKNGGRGKNTDQPKPIIPSAKKTWAEVVKNGGINVQIVLGNGKLGLTTPPRRKKQDTTRQRRPPPLHSQQRAPKPPVFSSDSDSQHSVTLFSEFSGNSTLFLLTFVAKSEFSRVLAYPTSRLFVCSLITCLQPEGYDKGQINTKEKKKEM